MKRIEDVGLEVFRRVNMNSCDLNGRMTLGNVFRTLTELAGLNVEQLGHGFQKMLDQRMHWVLSRMKVKMVRPAVAEEMLYLRTWPKCYQQKLFFIRDFEVVDGNAQPVFLASSAWLVIDADKRRLIPPSRLPDMRLPSLPHRVALEEPLEKLRVDDGEEKLLLTARYSDIDFLGHMNNARYVEAITDALPVECMTARRLDWIQVNYDQEVRLGEQVSVRVANPAADTWAVEGVNLNTSHHAFTALLKFFPSEYQSQQV